MPAGGDACVAPVTDSDASDIEISDIPPEEHPPSAALLALGTFFARFTSLSRAWRWATAAITIFVVLVLILRSLLSIPGQPFSTNPQAGIEPRPAMVLWHSAQASQPGNCPSNTSLQDFDPATFSPGIGASPIWITEPGNLHAHRIHSEGPNSAVQGLSSAYRVLLVVKSDFSGALLLSGENVRNGLPLFFDAGSSTQGQSSVTAFFRLDTRYPVFPSSYGDRQWRAWPLSFYILASGCYFLRVEWLGGSWQANFAAE